MVGDENSDSEVVLSAVIKQVYLAKSDYFIAETDYKTFGSLCDMIYQPEE